MNVRGTGSMGHIMIHRSVEGDVVRSVAMDRALFGLVLCGATEVSTKVTTRLPASGTGTQRHLYPLTPGNASCCWCGCFSPSVLLRRDGATDFGHAVHCTSIQRTEIASSPSIKHMIGLLHLPVFWQFPPALQITIQG